MAAVQPARQTIEAASHGTEARHEIVFLHLLELGDARDAVAREFRFERLADAPDHGDGFRGEEGKRFLAADDGEAARLVEIGSDLGEELVVGEADGNGDADFVLDAFCEASHADGGACVVQALGAREVEKGLVDGDRFDEGRQIAHQRANVARDRCIFSHVGFHDDGFRAGGERLEHGHGGADAADARDVAAGGNDAALAPADDEGLVAKLRIVALLDGGIEGVAIHVGDGEGVQLRVEEKARPAAGRAPLRAFRHGREAVAAEACGGGHGWRRVVEVVASISLAALMRGGRDRLYLCLAPRPPFAFASGVRGSKRSTGPFRLRFARHPSPPKFA